MDGWIWTQETTLGVLRGVASARGLLALTFDAAEAARAAASLGLRPDRTLAAEAEVMAQEIDGYLSGRSRRLVLPVDLALVTSPFHREVLVALQAVPFGRTTSYAALAEVLGRPRTAARAVGQAVARNPLLLAVPCHRVLAADGSLGGFSAGLWRKETLLRLEGTLRVQPELALGV